MSVKEWQDKFGLHNWQIEVQYDPNLTRIAKTVGDPRYQEAVITYQGNEGSLIPDRIIVHELIHIVMSMYDFYVDNKIEDEEVIGVARENAVSQLGEIFIRNYEKEK